MDDPFMARNFNLMVVSIADAAKEASKGLVQLSNAMGKFAAHEYLKRHKRLPGSNSTARLRKKRIDFVVREVF